MKNLTYIGAGWHLAAVGWHIARHRHDSFEMIVLAGGREIVRTGAGELTLSAGDVMLIPPGMAHEEWQDGRERVDSFFITFDGRLPSGLPLHVHDTDGRICIMARWLFESRLDRSTESGRLRPALLSAVAAEYLRCAARPGEGLAGFLHGYVHARAGQKLNVGEIASAAGLSKYHFIRAYRKETGVTPMADVRAIRAECARDMLLSTGLPVKAIAAACGLGTDVALYRLFRRQFGKRPGQIRRRKGKWN